LFSRKAVGEDNRAAVLETLRGSDQALTYEEIVAALIRAGRPIAVSTVERHVGALVKDGLARTL